MSARELTKMARGLALELGLSAALIVGLSTPTLLYAGSDPDEHGLTVETETDTKPVSGTVLSMPAQPATEDETPPAEVRNIPLPSHGMSMAEVERHFGAPNTKHAAVGKPPITRWDYNGFSVFFEYHTVLHAVRPDQPAPIERKNELVGGSHTSADKPAPSNNETPDTSVPTTP